jgi:hypothetical protein
VEALAAAAEATADEDVEGETTVAAFAASRDAPPATASAAATAPTTAAATCTTIAIGVQHPSWEQNSSLWTPRAWQRRRQATQAKTERRQRLARAAASKPRGQRSSGADVQIRAPWEDGGQLIEARGVRHPVAQATAEAPFSHFDAPVVPVAPVAPDVPVASTTAKHQVGFETLSNPPPLQPPAHL